MSIATAKGNGQDLGGQSRDHGTVLCSVAKTAQHHMKFPRENLPDTSFKLILNELQ